MVVQLGSMAIRGVFKSGSLLSGLGSTSNKLKEVQQRSKSTTTEMKRMTKGANMLKGALAAIGVAGFSALLLTTPQLAGSLAKIKSEMQRIAWSIGKHLKPALDAVATILRGIRTGDWSTVQKGVEDLTAALLALAAAGVKKVIEVVFGKEPVAEAEKDLNRWWEKVKTAFYAGDAGTLYVTLAHEPVAWAVDRIHEWFKKVDKELLMKGLLISATLIPTIKEMAGYGKYRGADKIAEDYGGHEYQTGGYVPRTGMYKLHQGETVTMSGSTPSGGSGITNEINIDFSGAVINLASGLELDQFANAISNRIAEHQSNLTY